MVEAIDNFVFFASSVEFPKKKEEAFSEKKQQQRQDPNGDGVGPQRFQGFEK